MIKPNPRFYYFQPKARDPIDRYNLWRGIARINHLSTQARLRLEWIIFYHTAAKQNVSCTCRHFGIARSVFYFWLSRFDETNLACLEDNKSTPKRKRSWNPDPIVLMRMIKLRKRYIHYGKKKLSVIYRSIYREHISSWQFQRLIEQFHLYPPRTRRTKIQLNGAKKQFVSLDIRREANNLYSVDTKTLHLFGRVYYIVAAVAHSEKIAYARTYTTHSSAAASDFLGRLIYLLNGKLEVVLTDNGSEFMKHFDRACRARRIKRYFSKPRNPKDNPEIERFIKTMLEEWLNDGQWSPDLHTFNTRLTNWLIEYNSVRPHQALNYLTPLQKAVQTGLVSKRYSSSTFP